jgi:uncharacterized protein (TIGR02118 family)
MPTLSVIFPSVPGASFDYDYVEQVHVPLVMERWGNSGLEAVDLVRGVSSPEGGDPPYLAIGMLRFGSLDQIELALSGEHVGEIGADIAKFTDVKPIMQVNVKIGG